MFRFLTIKDPHFRFSFQEPSSRVNFFQDIEKKLNFLNQYIIDNQINHLFFTGDVFDESIMSKWGFKNFLENKDVLETLKNSLKCAPYSIMGNHDFINGNFTIENTPFGEYVNNGYLNYFGDFYEKVYEQSLNFKVNDGIINLYGIDYKKDWATLNESLSALDIELEDKDRKTNFNIVFIHENVVKSFTDEKFECIDYKKLMDYKNIDMWVLGHYHKGYPFTIINNKYFVNNWNFTRLVRNNYAINEQHTPEFSDVKIDYQDGKFVVSVDTVVVPFSSYKDSFKEEVRNLLKLMEMDNTIFKSIEDFSSLTLEIDEVDDIKSLETIFSNTNFQAKILQKALDYMNNKG